MVGSKAIRETRVTQAHSSSSQTVVEGENFTGTSLKDFPTACKCLLKNPTFMCLALLGVPEGILSSGLASFAPKYIENQFAQTSSWAALITGKNTQIR